MSEIKRNRPVCSSSVLEIHHNEIVDVKAGTKVIGAELERRNAAAEVVIAEHKRCIDKEVKRWEEKHQVLASEVDLMEECQRKSIVGVLG